MNATTLQKVASREFLGLVKKKIGFLVLSTERSDLFGKWLGPKAEIFVCFWTIHFFVAKTTPGKRQLLKLDCQQSPKQSLSSKFTKTTRKLPIRQFGQRDR
jgi:hypothetical protein